MSTFRTDQGAVNDYLYMNPQKSLSGADWIGQFVQPEDDGYYAMEGQPLPSLSLKPKPAVVVDFPVPVPAAADDDGIAAAA